jgi:D-alanine-D-alanine ligase
MPGLPSILVLYNEPVLPRDHPEAESELDILETVGDVTKILAAAGFATRQLGVSLDPQPMLDELRAHRPDAVFNLFEGVPIKPGSEVAVAAILEWLDLPFTGCPTACLSLGRDKVKTKRIMHSAGLPTAQFQVVDDGAIPEWTGPWPAFVKPGLQDASVGIDQQSVVVNPVELAARVRAVRDQFGPPVLIEEFVGGREFHVNAIEVGAGALRSLLVLPFAEIAFRDARPDWWPVYTYTAKWDLNSDEYRDSPLVAPVELAPAPTAALKDLAARAFRLFQCRDFARIDVRMDAAGNFRILELNPNPYLISLALVRGLEAIGRCHEWLVVEMALSALARGGVAVPPGSIQVPVGLIQPVPD